jgi:hypothetical protein
LYTIDTVAGPISVASEVLATALCELYAPTRRSETDLLAALGIDLTDDTFEASALVA